MIYKDKINKKIWDLWGGILILLFGVFELVNLISTWRLYGFEETYLQTVGGIPSWMFVIGTLVGGIVMIFLFLKKNFKKKKKKFKHGVISEYLPWLIIAVAVLAIVIISIALMREKGVSMIDQIKNLIRP